ncbi:hypothetical protein I7I50_01419 [Histoplasma capsulatum G186AR]|uniref:Uncharacterized protein n=1 Tax=Ajellomyces capsulatus TaxID=5037 RepID=A0A8H7YGB6_AJECA|nr:hypothetical protein I7I52_12535 [Histoplasma capsulatum]QSS73301.1 hypothetical protein I7I50_01419 [Histoplasma capsulatum G186AR]
MPGGGGCFASDRPWPTTDCRHALLGLLTAEKGFTHVFFTRDWTTDLEIFYKEDIPTENKRSHDRVE